MTGSSGEAYLLLPFCFGVLGLLQRIRLKEFAHCDSSLKARQSWVVQEKKGPTGTGISFMLLCWLHAFLVMITVEQLFQKRGGVHTSRSFIACCVVRKLRPQLGHTPRVSSSAVFGCAGKLSLLGYLGLGSLDKSVFYVTNLSQVKMLFLTLLVKYSTHQTNALICYVITWHRTRLTNLGKIVRRFSGVPVHFFNIS